MIDFVSTAVSAGTGGVAAAVSMFIRMIRSDAKLQTQLDSQSVLLKEQNAKLDALDEKYLTRREFELSQRAIQDSLGRIERLQETLVNRELNPNK
jgi:hypothetical protein